jgi:3-oxoacyl-[acyl-carrier protein] reductase
MQLTDKVAIVTGGSRGIGRAIVRTLSLRGARVFFSYHKNEHAAREAAGVSGATPILCPQNDIAAIEKAVDEVRAATGRIDILVNNAGITADQFLMMMPSEQWEKVIDTNLSGAFRWVKAVSHCMLNARQGAIVNVASVAGLVGTAGQTNYAASKGGLLAFTRALAAEMGPKGVRVNAVVPGFIETDMTAVMPRQIKRDNLQRILLKRFGTAEEVASVVGFLVSEEAAYIVGQAIVVDGGLTATAG